MSHSRASAQKTEQAGKPPPNRTQYSSNSERVNKSSGLIDRNSLIVNYLSLPIPINYQQFTTDLLQNKPIKTLLATYLSYSSYSKLLFRNYHTRTQSKNLLVRQVLLATLAYLGWGRGGLQGAGSGGVGVGGVEFGGGRPYRFPLVRRVSMSSLMRCWPP